MVRVFPTILMVAASLSAEHVYIGTSGKGIYLADFDTKSGKLSAPAMVSDTAAPSYLTIHEGHLYAVNEVNDGAVSSFTIDRSSGKLTPLNSMSVKSAGPCYIAIDKSGIRRSRRITRAAASRFSRSGATGGWARRRILSSTKGRDRIATARPCRIRIGWALFLRANWR